MKANPFSWFKSEHRLWVSSLVFGILIEILLFVATLVCAADAGLGAIGCIIFLLPALLLVGLGELAIQPFISITDLRFADPWLFYVVAVLIFLANVLAVAFVTFGVLSLARRTARLINRALSAHHDSSFP